MTRRLRSFPRLAAAVAALVVMPLGLVTAGSPAAADGPAQSDRQVVDFTEDWRFALANRTGIEVPPEYADAVSAGYDDSGWRLLDVPHDWSIELDPSPGPGTTAGTGYFEGGLGFYRKTFTLPPSAAGKKVSIEFDGVYMNSEVYVNDRLVGTHPYGYTGFAFDLTPFVHTDGTANVVAVKVQNQVPSSRWYSGSGIYRKVRLVLTGPVHVARFGTFVTTPDVAATIGDGYVDLNVSTEVANEGDEASSVRIGYRVRDESGRVVATGGSSLQVGPGSATGTARIRLRHPRLWSIESPYRYTLETSLSVRGRQVDQVSTPFGVRWVEIDPAEGMVLNGRYTKIKGVDLHHDLGALGAAVNWDALWRQMSIMKRMGVNALRTAHNPPAPELVDVCDRLGIMVMVEAFDTWRNNKTANDYGDWFELPAPGTDGLLWSDVDIMEMVHTFKNAPSVIMWSIGNEIRGQTVADAQRLIADIKSIDTTRPVVWGSDSYRTPPSPTSVNGQIAQLLDGVGLNYNTAQSVDALHALYPDTFFFESESSSSTSTRGFYQWPDLLNTGEDYTPGRRMVSSYDNNMASWTMPGEYGLKKDRDRKFFTGEFLWSGFDYLGEPTPYNGQFPVKSAFFGAVDTAGFPKDLYYAFASQWTTTPMVHLVPMNWTDYEPGETVTVWAYANVDTVELFLNGRSLGVKRYDRKTTTFGTEYLETTEPTGDDKTFPSGSYTSPNGSSGKLHLTWTVPFEPGVLTAVARRDGVAVATDTLRTAGEPYTLRLTPDRRAIPADGTSLSYVTVEVVDSRGVVVPSADNLIRFTVEGGSLAGVDNGRQESAESYQAPRRSAFNGKALAIVRSDEDPGPVVVTASADGLLPASTTIFDTATDSRSGRVAPGGRGKPARVVGIVDPSVRTPVGVAPDLPRTVTVVYSDGSATQARVKWSRIDREQLESRRPYDVKGVVTGRPGGHVVAHVTPYRVADVQRFATSVPVGVAPYLPGEAEVAYSDGVTDEVRVTWDQVPPGALAVPGTFTLRGTLADTPLTTTIEVTVSDAYTPGQNLAPAGTPSASFSGSPQTVPAALTNGVLPEENGWSNRYTKAATALLPAVSQARPSDWVSVTWADPQVVASVVAYFRLAPGRTFPASMSVEYWDGRRFVPAAHQAVTRAAGSEQPTTITFDKVATTAVRLVMTSAGAGTPDGFVQISELATIGDLPD
jgi:beta-galactosidase